MSSMKENMIKINIPFSPPDISEAEINEVVDTLRSGWITTGPKTKKLEKLIAGFVGTPRAVCLNSQTACSETALRILGVGKSDEVITCAYTYTATASVICHVGATPVLVDCQKDSLEMDYDALETAITKNTKVIIPIDLGGVPCDYNRIFQIVEKKKYMFHPSSEIQAAYGRVIVMADAAHAFGACWHGKMVGNIADISNYSYHAVKNFTTAEGGAMVWRHVAGINDEEIYHQAQLLSLHGQSKDALAKTQRGAWEYDIVDTWYKCNMTDITASLGLAQFSRYTDILKRRRWIINQYDAAFKQLGVKVLEHFTKAYTSCGHLYLTWIPGITLEQRNDIITKMAERGVSCNVHYKPLPMHTAYKKLGFDIKDYPNSYCKFKNEITLPLHTKLTDEEIIYVIDNYSEILKDYI